MNHHSRMKLNRNAAFHFDLLHLAVEIHPEMSLEYGLRVELIDTVPSNLMGLRFPLDYRMLLCYE